MSKTCIVIVNFRTPDMAVDCLASIAAQLDAMCGGKAVLVDNASGDGSVERITRAIDAAGWQGWADVLAQPRNGGFSSGNNAGIARALTLCAEAEFILLLNPDAMLKPGALTELVGFLKGHPRAGIAGCKIESLPGHVQRSAHAMPRPVDELLEDTSLQVLERWLGHKPASDDDSSKPRRCGWVSGAALMIRREALEQVGGLDEGFFLYYEEVDLCRRVKAAGWEVWHVPSGTVIHAEGASTGITEKKRRRPAYWFASRRRFFVKAYGIGGLLLADAFRLAGRLVFVVRKWFGLGRSSRHDAAPAGFVRDLLLGDAKAFLNGEIHAIRR